MQVTKLTSPADTSVPAGYQLSEKQLYDEINYRRSEKLTKKCLQPALSPLMNVTRSWQKSAKSLCLF